MSVVRQKKEQTDWSSENLDHTWVIVRTLLLNININFNFFTSFNFRRALHFVIMWHERGHLT